MTDATYDIGYSSGRVRRGFFQSLLSINAATPWAAPPAVIDGATMLQVTGAPGAGARAEFNTFGGNSVLVGRQANGTPAAPTATKNGDVFITLGGRGYGATGYSAGNRATLLLTATENWTDAAQGANLILQTTTNGSITPTNRWQVTHDGNLDPMLDATYDLGAAGARARNGYFSGALNAATVNLTGTATVAGLAVSGSLSIGVTHKLQIFEAVDHTYTRINMDTVNPSMWTWDAVNHALSWQGNGAAAPQFSITDTGGNFAGTLNVLGNVLNCGPTSRLHLATDAGATYGQVALDWQNLCAWRVTWATADLNWLVNGTPVFNISGAGNAHVYGTLRVDGATTFVGAITVPSLTATGSVTAASHVVPAVAGSPALPGMSMFNGPGYSRITMDTSATPAFWTWDSVNRNLQFTAINATGPNLTLGQHGDLINGEGNFTALRTSAGFWGEVMLDDKNGYGWRCDWNVGGRLSWLAAGSPKMTLDATGFAYFWSDVNCGQTRRVQLGDQANGIGYLYLDTVDHDRFESNWTSHSMQWIVNNVPLWQCLPNGNVNNTGTLQCAGNLFIGNGVKMALASDNATYSQVILDATNNVSLYYNISNGKLVLMKGATPLWSVDGLGNMVCKGTFTPNGSPGLFDVGEITGVSQEAIAEAQAEGEALRLARSEPIPFAESPA
jgi:hypothetical protein